MLIYGVKTPGLLPTAYGRWMMTYTIRVNGLERTVDVDGDSPLLWVLRDELDLKGSKFGCGVGLCGACTVHLNGEAARSCLTPVSTVGEAAVATIEGMALTLSDGAASRLDRRSTSPSAVIVRRAKSCRRPRFSSKTPHPTDR